jgi:hypothetical protein
MAEAVELPRQMRSQVQLGNKEIGAKDAINAKCN